jgi:CRP/FNR family cyclic AMP-dependent transcriptional regulator
MAHRSNRHLTPAAFLQQAGTGRSIRVYQDNEILYSQGDPADAVFYIQSGMVRLMVASKRGRKKAVLAILREGDFCGEGCLGGEAQRPSTAISIGLSTVIRVERRVFRQYIDRDPRFAAVFIKFLISQTDRFKADLSDHFFNFSERRLARILLMHRGFGKSGTFNLPISQTTLAEMVGTTRGRVSGFMAEFKKKGYVRYNGGLEIDAKRLTAFLQS